MDEPRFYILEHTGFTIRMTMGERSGASRPMNEVMVRDRDYNHAVAWHQVVSDANLIHARSEAARIVRRLHEQDAEELAA